MDSLFFCRIKTVSKGMQSLRDAKRLPLSAASLFSERIIAGISVP